MNDKIIISGGGTGGHIFPALSIANSIREINPDCEILFVGAEGKMEMEKVPSAGYPIKGLPVAGLKRKLAPSNMLLPFKVLKSIRMAGKIIKEFKPDVVVGVGGYASAPVLWSASRRKIPTLIQEQNSFAGLTNKILSKKASKICVAYGNMDKFFPKEKILFTGNPIRKNIRPYTAEEKKEGLRFFGLREDLPCIIIVGGSLGCRTLNETMKQFIKGNNGESAFQVVWQSGKGYAADLNSFFGSIEGAEVSKEGRKYNNIVNFDFISRMDHAFAAADIIVSRAGAGTISELCAAGKAAIFVPSPVVAEDHQTHNAMALVEKKAARMVKDCDAQMQLFPVVEEMLSNKEELSSLEKNILLLAKPDAGRIIAEEVLKLIEKK